MCPYGFAIRVFAAVAFSLISVDFAFAWDAHGHRTITYLALDGLPADMPAFLRDPNNRNRIADEGNEPDRWRGTRHIVMGHENNMEHYIDIDQLDQFGLTLDTLPPLRNEYLRAMIISKHEHPEKVDDYDARRDADRSREWPGMLPYGIMEEWVKLQSSFQSLRILEKLNDPQRAFQVENARNNVIYHMGILAHYIGDGAQPLHTTIHHHGWTGPNPNNYTTDGKIHSYIDGGCIEKHKLTYADLRPRMKYTAKVDVADPWRDALDYLAESHKYVEDIYRMEKNGDLDGGAGKEFLSQRLMAGGDMLKAFYVAAWISSAPDKKDEQDWIRYNNLKPEVLPKDVPAPVAGESDGHDAKPGERGSTDAKSPADPESAGSRRKR